MRVFLFDVSHSFFKHGNTFVQGAQEGVLFLLNHLGNQLLLGLQFREGVTHLINEGGDELIQETILLSEEGIGIAYCTAQNTTDNVAGLGIRGQLTVGNREGYSAQVVGTDSHGDVDLLLACTRSTSLTSLTSLLLEGSILQACNLLLGLDDRLEDVSIVVRVLALHHTNQALEAHTSVDDVHR